MGNCHIGNPAPLGLLAFGMTTMVRASVRLACGAQQNGRVDGFSNRL